jgi:hypothetical protein
MFRRRSEPGTRSFHGLSHSTITARIMRELELEVLSSRTTQAMLPWVLWLIALGSSACVSPAVQGRAVPVEPGRLAPPAGANLLKVATFDSDTSAPWSTVFSAPADGEGAVKDGAYCLVIRNAARTVGTHSSVIVRW